MPLSPPAPRDLIHVRDIACRGWKRLDGLWDIEARLTDSKTYSWPNHDRGRIGAGEYLHDIQMRVTIDTAFTIQAVEVVYDSAPFRICPQVADRFQALVGLTIGKGFLKEARRLFAGAQGCVHVIDLLTPIATTAVQSLVGVRYDTARKRLRDEGRKPPMIDSCYAMDARREVVAREWPDFALPDKAGGEP